MVYEDDKRTHSNPEMFEEDRPAETDVIEMSEKMYTRIFNGPEPPEEKWLLVFTRKQRTHRKYWMASYLVNVCRMLADEYAGTVRFAYVDAPRQENLKETFMVKTLPRIFLYSNGTFYEPNAGMI
mmetsp:Transcript_10646/g.13176  ORF Transcript_10646/g.13176 Transcript_10646/m.13176 type:complete len:125 (+) Transcript_10646:165-539(+)|eukprot:CAMPEP_0170472680 /NCGR_PEP_ID=MMETSP0123-20130129/14685_1 /TAXON_ID=182087 /ORGANISM="Favella ehrenbergii, Strain Fehren 1" /LENGTH=124 /DNA_ID=CAMNT_0010741141 /DNA_START=74 /DNA_END=448 /DNA_ORIENTATION=-